MWWRFDAVRMWSQFPLEKLNVAHSVSETEELANATAMKMSPLFHQFGWLQIADAYQPQVNKCHWLLSDTFIISEAWALTIFIARISPPHASQLFPGIPSPQKKPCITCSYTSAIPPASRSHTPKIADFRAAWSSVSSFSLLTFSMNLSLYLKMMETFTGMG